MSNFRLLLHVSHFLKCPYFLKDRERKKAMPELPEVETVRRSLAKAMEGKPISQVSVWRDDLRIPVPQDFSDSVKGLFVHRVGRRAKYLQIFLDKEKVILIHLGMSGKMLVDIDSNGSNKKLKHEHVTFLIGDRVAIRFVDPRRFGLIDLCTRDKLSSHPLLVHLGLEPLTEEFSDAYLKKAFKNKKVCIKAALLNQHMVAGLGNIYACEALWYSCLSPRRNALTITGKRAERLAQSIKQVLTEAISRGGSTLRDHVSPDGEMGYFQNSFKVYGRAGAPCFSCNKPVQKMIQLGRSTFFCPNCQR